MKLSVYVCITLLESVSAVVETVLPKQAGPDTPWEELRNVLSSPDILTTTSAEIWNEQCISPYVEAGEINSGVSNWLLLNQSSGLCLGHASCAFEKCAWPRAFPVFPPQANPFAITPDGENALIDEDLQDVELPAMVLQPNAASDIVQAVEFCQEHDVGITVKVAGHSYFGASNANGTLLIKMNPNYPKYAIGGSLVECDDIVPLDVTNTSEAIPSANQMACALATARGKPAVMRVGGGELFDEAYRAVFFDWNSANPDQKYHLIGGGAGTVSAAGGWMASGGLSGTTGMRMFGVGIDQVLALELVLPNGQHVRLAPTEWEAVESGDGYPQTKSVTGYCNAKPYESDESLWEWTVCPDDVDIDFNELWFAVRGGGGGTWGVLTSLHYQVHEYPGALYSMSLGQVDPTAIGNVTSEGQFAFTTKYIDFMLKFLYMPEKLNVSQADSRGCNSPQLDWNPLNPGNTMLCYGNSSETLVRKWGEYISDPMVVQDLQAANLPQLFIDDAPNFFEAGPATESYAHQVLVLGSFTPGVPEGRLPDSPITALIPFPITGIPYTDLAQTHVPNDAVLSNTDALVELLALYAVTQGGLTTAYLMGGMIPSADDGMNALPPTRRNAAFWISVLDEGIRARFFTLLYGGIDMSGDFPGSSCHNHAAIYEMGPLKTNWSTPCPMRMPQEEREEKCISQNEAAFGTANLAQLNAFKAKIDPNNLFICVSGVGYSNPVKTEDGSTANTSATPDTPTVAPTDAPTDASAAYREWQASLTALLAVLVLAA